MYGSSVVDGTGQVVLDDLMCTGSESRLIDCRHNKIGIHDCDHSQDVGVRCTGIILRLRLSVVIHIIVCVLARRA